MHDTVTDPAQLPERRMNPYAQRVLKPLAKQRHEITAGLRAHEGLIFDFAQAWYASPYTFLQTRVLGFGACKIPFDLWILMDLFHQYRFDTVIECGTAAGGTTLWYALLMDMLKIEGGQIISIDIEPEDPENPRPVHPRIRYVRGSTTDEAIVQQVMGAVRPPLTHRTGNFLLNLDSDHHAPHVLRELELWAKYVPVGSWLVVEDTNGCPVVEDPQTGEPHSVEGPFAAVMEYLQGHPGEWIREVVCERYMLTMCPHGWLQRQAPYRETR